MANERHRTRNGVGVRTQQGWTWVCDHCHRPAHLGLTEDTQDLDVAQVLESIDTIHWCRHKEEPAK